MDPTEDGVIALCIAILWYDELTPEQAFSMLYKDAKPRTPLRTIELLSEYEVKAIYTTISNPRFSNTQKICKKYGVHESVLTQIAKGP